jgi:hypothetical protein
LRLQIGHVVKAPLLEKGSFDEADQILDGSFGQSRQLRLMARLRSESSVSPIRSTR